MNRGFTMNYKKILYDNKGFTLIELIVVVGIISIMTAIITYSVNVVFKSDVQSSAKQLQSDLRNIRFNTMATSNCKFRLKLNYNSTTNNYYYEVCKDANIIRKVEFKTNVSIKKDSIENELKDTDMLPIDFIFNEGDGSFVGENNSGIFEFWASNSVVPVTLDIVKETGRIYINE
jgi:prepilin-type N-terminal cleavage/methylation domain-containing protein